MYEPLFESIEWVEHAAGHQPLPSPPDDARRVAEKIRAFVRSHCLTA